MKNEFRKQMKVLLAGFLHALKAAGAFGLLATAAFLFYCTAVVQGYEAVGTFVAANLCIVCALSLFYFCGRDIKKGAFSK